MQHLRIHSVNGNTKTIGVKNLSRVEIEEFAYDLRNQIGRKMGSTGYKKPVLSNRPSIQGEWNESMDLTSFEITLKHL